MELKELAASLTVARAETERALARLAEAAEQAAMQSAETGRELAETDRKLAELAERGDKRAAEMDRHLAQLEGLHGIQFGRLVEAIVAPSCLKLFQERSIQVTETMRRVTKMVEGEELEIDVLLVNAGEVVAVEVKSAFRVRDVQDALDDLERFRKGFSGYSKHTLYGAVAALEYLEESSRYAARKGLFVLNFAGGLMAIANPLNFQAKKF